MTHGQDEINFHFKTTLTCSTLNHRKLRLLKFTAPEHMLERVKIKKRNE